MTKTQRVTHPLDKLAVIRPVKAEPPVIKIRSALEIASEPLHATWLLEPYVERKASVLMFGDAGTFKSFLALDWAAQIARLGEPALVLSAEGRGLWKRLRAWCLQAAPNTPWQDTLADMPLHAVEVPLNLSASETLLALQHSIDSAGFIPSLVVIDTLSRYSDGNAEATNEDASSYLNQLDQAIRVKYESSFLLVHHTGHMEKKRARGAYSLTANTDANFLLERPDPKKFLVTVTSGRMKDCEPPLPFEIEGVIKVLDEMDSKGRPETSLAIRYTGAIPVKENRPTGKAQQKLLAELERLTAEPGNLGVWSIQSLREIGRGIGMHRNTARDAALGLIQLHVLTATIGGYRISNEVQDK